MLGFVDTQNGKTIANYSDDVLLKKFPLPPESVDEAIEMLMNGMSLKQKVTMANMNADNLVSLQQKANAFIKRMFRLEYGNEPLLASCRSISGESVDTADEISAVIIGILFKKLSDSHRLRVITQNPP